jgi:mercuric ion binding protein
MTILKLLLGGTIFALLSGNTIGGEIQSATLKIEDMTCASCPLTVKQALKKVSGVTEVHIDFKTKFAQVKFDPDKTQPDQLAKAITQIGYPTTVKK